MHFFLYLLLFNQAVQLPGFFDTEEECRAKGASYVADLRKTHDIGFFECWQGGKGDVEPEILKAMGLNLYGGKPGTHAMLGPGGAYLPQPADQISIKEFGKTWACHPTLGVEVSNGQ